jgi:hypothetical protein
MAYPNLRGVLCNAISQRAADSPTLLFTPHLLLMLGQPVRHDFAQQQLLPDLRWLKSPTHCYSDRSWCTETAAEVTVLPCHLCSLPPHLQLPHTLPVPLQAKQHHAC